jgi:creatinine amidohydrolase/Fe(II)-dependent formamide hydrolase-like protein
VTRYRWIHEATDRGVYGDPTFGSAEKGEKFVDAAVEVLVRIVKDIKQGKL